MLPSTFLASLPSPVLLFQATSPILAPVPTAPVGAINQWTLVLGITMPFLVAIVNQSHWSRRCKAVIAGLTSLAAACVQLGIEGHLTSSNVLSSTLTIWTLALVFFSHFWKPLGFMKALEQASDVTAPRALEGSHE